MGIKNEFLAEMTIAAIKSIFDDNWLLDNDPEAKEPRAIHVNFY
jgi:hypothetical protein